jgi:putative ABC-type multidrug transport system, ATPase component
MYTFEEFLRKIDFSYDNWDDYGYKTTARIYLKNENDVVESVNINIYPNKREVYIELCQGKKPEDKNFCTLGSQEYYNFINENIKKKDRKKWYKLTNDLAYNKDLFLEMLDNKEILFLRSSFLRFRNKNEVITQLHRMASKGGKYLDAFNLKLQDNEKVVLEINVNPKDLIPKNTYCIIGKNGTGKSHFLKNIAKSVLGEETSYALEVENEKNLENVIFISYSPFDETVDIKNKDNFYQIGLNSVNIEEKETIFDYFNRELVDNIIAIQNPVAIKSKELWEEILEKFSYEEWVRKLLEKLSNLDQKIENDLLETKKFLKTEIEKLSSGQKIVLLSLTSLLLKVKEKTFVLVDEPELFLHPSMIKSYTRALIEIITKNNGICIIATHNPIVLQEIQTSCVKIIKSNREIEAFEKLGINSFGENINTLNNLIFGLDIQNTGYYELISSLSRMELERERELLRKIMGSEGRVILSTFMEIEDEKA